MGLLICKYAPFWQEFSVKSLILRWTLRPVGLLLILLLRTGVFCSHINFIVAMKSDMAGNLAKFDFFAFFNNLMVNIQHTWNKRMINVHIKTVNKKANLTAYSSKSFACQRGWYHWHGVPLNVPSGGNINEFLATVWRLQIGQPGMEQKRVMCVGLYLESNGVYRFCPRDESG